MVSLRSFFWRTTFAIGVAATLLTPATVLSHHDDLAQPTDVLGTYGEVDPSEVTISGLSSGGFFAHQFHVAYSKLVKGAGIIAGGPYGCVETVGPYPGWVAASSICAHYHSAVSLPGAPTGSDSFDLVQDAFQNGRIDNPSFLKNSRVWLFRGDKDELIPPATVDALADLYGKLNTQLVFRRNQAGERPANHGIPVHKFEDAAGKAPVSCEVHAAPFVVECGSYEAAEMLFQHLYSPNLNAPVDPHAQGRLKAFDQTEFFDTNDIRVGLSKVGYVFVPTSCESGAVAPATPRKCHLHVAFHGCNQSVDKVHDDFVRDAGCNRWAAANNIIVLYPQAKKWEWDPPVSWSDPLNVLANPQGCWDYWGYSGLDYRNKNGKQMRAVKAMIDRVRGRND